jgi:hypothetical protein
MGGIELVGLDVRFDDVKISLGRFRFPIDISSPFFHSLQRRGMSAKNGAMIASGASAMASAVPRISSGRRSDMREFLEQVQPCSMMANSGRLC